MKKLLIIGYTYPEPTTTAAGGRMMQLIEQFLNEDYKITFATTAGVSDKGADLLSFGISSEAIVLNDSSFDDFINRLEPHLVLFDRYITEEQFGWRVAESCPNAVRILDTEDLHFLRKARQEAFRKNIPLNKTDLFSETAKRELASILRCDLSLIISEVEMDLLQDTFRVASDVLCYLPFLIENISEKNKQKLPPFNGRTNFITIGNLFHAPNVDAVVYLKKEIWPLIRKQLPEAQLHIFGAYAPKHISEMHQPKEGFYIEGWTPSVSEVMKKAKVCLAPLRFGAGLKGKIFDAMHCGTPVVTTSIGAEGIFEDTILHRNIHDDVNAFVERSVRMYSEIGLWSETRDSAFEVLENRFDKSKFSEAFRKQLIAIQENVWPHRNRNFISQILQHQSLQASKYMSKWIEEKGK